MPKISMDLFSKSGARITVEGTGENPEEAIKDLYATVEIGMKSYGWKLDDPIPAKAESPAPSVKTPTTKTPAAKLPASKQPTGESSAKVPQTLVVERVVVTPKPDHKVELQLFGKGDKWPRLFHNGDITNILKALEGTELPWEESELSMANEFRTTFLVDWIESDKPNSKGNPYKDILAYHSVESA